MTSVRNSTVLKALAVVGAATTAAGGANNGTNSSALATTTTALATTPPPPNCDQLTTLVNQEHLPSTTCGLVDRLDERRFPFDETYQQKCGTDIPSCTKICPSDERVKNGATQLSVSLTREKSLTLSLTGKDPVAVEFHSGGCFVGGLQSSSDNWINQTGVILDKTLTKYGKEKGNYYNSPCRMLGKIMTNNDIYYPAPATLCLSGINNKFFECVQNDNITIKATTKECAFSLSIAPMVFANAIEIPQRPSPQITIKTTPLPTTPLPTSSAEAISPTPTPTPTPPTTNATFAKASGNTASWGVILISMLAGGFLVT